MSVISTSTTCGTDFVGSAAFPHPFWVRERWVLLSTFPLGWSCSATWLCCFPHLSCGWWCCRSPYLFWVVLLLFLLFVGAAFLLSFWLVLLGLLPAFGWCCVSPHPPPFEWRCLPPPPVVALPFLHILGHRVLTPPPSGGAVQLSLLLVGGADSFPGCWLLYRFYFTDP